jgi:hypothetical protein
MYHRSSGPDGHDALNAMDDCPTHAVRMPNENGHRAPSAVGRPYMSHRSSGPDGHVTVEWAKDDTWERGPEDRGYLRGPPSWAAS